MGWNHRVVRRVFPDAPGTPVLYGIHEAFCDNQGRVWGITEEPVRVTSDGEEPDPVAALRWTLDKMLKALDKPVIDYDKIPEEGALTPNWTADLDEGEPDETIFPEGDEIA